MDEAVGPGGVKRGPGQCDAGEAQDYAGLPDERVVGAQEGCFLAIAYDLSELEMVK